MGIPGLLKEIGKGERVALAKLAIDHFEKHKRPLRIAIDAAIWNFQNQAGQGGKNPALRTLFFRLLKLLALPIHPVFVYDGKNKPLTKRGKTVSRYGTCVPNELSKNLVARFQFPHHTAPGEAEAECAFLQKNGIVDAVMSQDVDAIMFGSSMTLRDWSKEGTKGNKTPTHVNVLSLTRIQQTTGLNPAGMIMVALLSGGDYHEGLPGFGPALSCSIARAGFGDDLLGLVENNDDEGLQEWRQRLQYELETNESGYFAKRHKTLKVPPDFPDRAVLSYYLEPAVSRLDALKKLEARWLQWWAKEIDVPALRDYVGMTFDWLYKGGARKLIRCLAQPLFQHHLKTRNVDTDSFTTKDVGDRRQHFINDGTPELRLSVVPAEVVGIDLDAEEENPEFAELDEEAGGDDEMPESNREASVDTYQEPSSPTKRRQRPPWDPHVAEKWWIPEHLLRIALPRLLQSWEQEQAEIRADPIKFATRKCRQQAKPNTKASRKIDQSMKAGALKDFLNVVKSSETSRLNVSSSQPSLPQARVAKKPLERSKSNPQAALSLSQDASMQHFFKSAKTSALNKPHAAQHDPSSGAVSISQEVNASLQDVATPRARKPFSRSQTMPAGLPSGGDHDIESIELPPSVTQRRRRPMRVIPDEDEEDEEILCIGSQKLPPPIESFFAKPSIGCTRTSPIETPGHSASYGETSKVCLPQFHVDPIEMPLALPAGTTTALGLGKASRKFVISRDSLPGAWRELVLTPSQTSKIAFVDLTNS